MSRKCIKNIIHKRSDAFAYLIMQGIVSFFIILYINYAHQNYLNLFEEMGIYSFFKTIIIFLILFIFSIKYNLKLKLSFFALNFCVIVDYILYKLYYFDYPLIFSFINLTTVIFLPFFMLSLSKHIYQKILFKNLKKISIVKRLYFRYILILLFLLFFNILIPFIISVFFMLVNIETFFIIFIFYEVLLSRFLPFLTLLVAIILQQGNFYTKKIAPHLIKLILFGGGIDIFLYFKINYDLFQLKNNIIPISFIATFLPMYFVYLLSIVSKKFKKLNYKSH